MKTNKTIYIITFLLLFLNLDLFAQQTPAKKQDQPISIVGATIHIGDGTILENGTIVFENGTITQIGKSETITPVGHIINADNKHIYPGFIIPNSTLGLGEIDAVRATLDVDETGDFLPHIRSLIAYNAESKVSESVRPNGVLLAQIVPQGGRISGSSSIVQLDAWNWEDAVLKANDGIHLNWPNSLKRKNVAFGNVIISEPNKDYDQQIIELKHYFAQAIAYSKSVPKTMNLSFEAMKGIIQDEMDKMILFLHVNQEKEIVDAVEFCKELGLKKIVLVGGDEAYKVSDLLVKNNIPVLLNRVHSLPSNEDDDYDISYKNAVLLVNKGVLVGLQNSGRMERMNVRNLPFYAGTVASYGLEIEKALQLITLNTAKILGINDRYGSLEIGKSATLFVSQGNALDMRTNLLTQAYIDGRNISLETHQTALWKRYMKKYSHQ